MAQGLRQGCVLSPLLFNVFFAAILRIVLRDSVRTQAYSRILSTYTNSRRKLALKRHRNVCGALFGDAVCRRRVHRVTVNARAGADDGGLRRSLRRIWSDHLREQDGDHVHDDPARTDNEDSLQRHGATVPSDNLLYLPGRHSD